MMNQNASFLRSLSAVVRRLVAESKAIHCTEADARDLDLLAELVAAHGHLNYSRIEGTAVCWQDITPSDFTWGWLRLSRYEPAGYDWEIDRVNRAAVYAELATLAASIWAPPEGAYETKVSAHDGTKEGARAAWAFIANHPLTDEKAIPIARNLGMTSMLAFVSLLQKTCNHYRSELEILQ